MINKKAFDTSTDPGSSVDSYVWVSALIFALGFIGALVFPVTACLSGSNSMELMLIIFVKSSFFLSVMVMMLANLIWGLYKDDGCYISVVGNSFLIGGEVLLYLYIGFLIAESCVKDDTKQLLNLLMILVLFGYAILSLAQAGVTFHKSRDPASLILVVLSFASIFEVPATLFGLAAMIAILNPRELNRQSSGLF